MLIFCLCLLCSVGILFWLFQQHKDSQLLFYHPIYVIKKIISGLLTNRLSLQARSELFEKS